MGLCLVPQTGESIVLSAQPAPVPCIGTLVAAAPCVGGSADLPMEREGNIAWGVEWWRLMLVVECCCVVVVW